MTKTITALMSATLLAAAPAAFAMTEADPTIDTNADGVYSLEEMQAAFPELTDETFITIDANADGLVDMEEVAAAQEAALLPVTDG